jgi:hypothetical protein
MFREAFHAFEGETANTKILHGFALLECSQKLALRSVSAGILRLFSCSKTRS